MLEVVYYTNSGDPVTKEEDAKGKILAKETKSNFSGQTSYYVLCCGGSMYNPNNTGTYTRSMIWKMTRVNMATFDLYLKFLQTKRVALLRQAERTL